MALKWEELGNVKADKVETNIFYYQNNITLCSIAMTKRVI